MGGFEIQRRAVPTAAQSARASGDALVWVAFALGVASAVPGMAIGLLGVPLGVAATAVSLVALIRPANQPRERRGGEMLTLVGLGFGVFQVVFSLVAFYSVRLG